MLTMQTHLHRYATPWLDLMVKSLNDKIESPNTSCKVTEPTFLIKVNWFI